MSKRGNTRERLLETAMTLIWAHSYGSTTVDEICKQAGAQKGSFYHYFSSKAELAMDALENTWQGLRAKLDHIFSSQVPPLQRLRLFAEKEYQTQVEEFEKLGFVVGCPYTTIGSEQCAFSDGLTERSWEILLRVRKYISQALRDAHEEGSLEIKDCEQSTNDIFFHMLGALAASRLSNSVEPSEGLFEVWMRILGHASYGKAGS